MTGLRSIVDLILYANVWIALAAMSMVLQIQLLLGKLAWPHNHLASFIFFSTVFVYTCHRLIGAHLYKQQDLGPRFNIYLKYSGIMIGFAGTALFTALFFFLKLEAESQVLLLFPSVCTLLYMIPVWKGRRLRDLPFVKILTIGLVWMWVTVWVPYQAIMPMDMGGFFISLEKLCFIVGITVPFDIRDRQPDLKQGVATLATVLSPRHVKQIIILCFAMAAACAIWAMGYELYSREQCVSILTFYAIALVFAIKSDENCHDYYFSGVLDGLVILQFVFVCLFTAR